jgi:hypothetical protein
LISPFGSVFVFGWDWFSRSSSSGRQMPSLCFLPRSHSKVFLVAMLLAPKGNDATAAFKSPELQSFRRKPREDERHF